MLKTVNIIKTQDKILNIETLVDENGTERVTVNHLNNLVMFIDIDHDDEAIHVSIDKTYSKHDSDWIEYHVPYDQFENVIQLVRDIVSEYHPR